MKKRTRLTEKYEIQYKDGVIKCILTDPFTTKEITGKAGLYPGDQMNVEFGRKLAYKRAFLKKVNFDIRQSGLVVEKFDRDIEEIVRLKNKTLKGISNMKKLAEKLENEISDMIK
jgi:hypothetical protein